MSSNAIRKRFRKLTTRRILETHDKTAIVLASFAITTAGWWAWNAFLSGVYAPVASPYGVRDGFSLGFGKDPAWWLSLVAALIILGVLELGYKTVKRQLMVTGSSGSKCSWARFPWQVFRRKGRGNSSRTGVAPGCIKDERPPWEWELDLWQEMEKDPAVRAQLKSARCETVESKDVLD